MKKIKISVFTILSLLIAGITFYSCTTEEIGTKENATINKLEFNVATKKGESNDVLNNVIFDGIPANEFIANNGIDKVSFINLINEESNEMSSYNIETFSKNKKNCLVKKLETQ